MKLSLVLSDQYFCLRILSRKTGANHIIDNVRHSGKCAIVYAGLRLFVELSSIEN